MEIRGSVALVTGANRGLGAACCRALLEAGAATVYAGARDPRSVSTDGVIPIRLDITSPADIDAAVARCDDIDLLINNAGITTGTGMLDDDAIDNARREFETNVFGPLAMSRAFAPTLAENGGGAIVNVLSVLSWFASPNTALYCAAKAASWSLTNALRQELLAQHTQSFKSGCQIWDIGEVRRPAASNTLRDTSPKPSQRCGDNCAASCSSAAPTSTDPLNGEVRSCRRHVSSHRPEMRG